MQSDILADAYKNPAKYGPCWVCDDWYAYMTTVLNDIPICFECVDAIERGDLDRANIVYELSYIEERAQAWTK